MTKFHSGDKEYLVEKQNHTKIYHLYDDIESNNQMRYFQCGYWSLYPM